jgi:hypothetical protein
MPFRKRIQQRPSTINYLPLSRQEHASLSIHLLTSAGVSWRNQAFTQACAFSSPFSASMSEMGI